MADIDELKVTLAGLVGGQVDELIVSAIQQENVENGEPPAGKTSGTGRFGGLQNKMPRDLNSIYSLANGNNDPKSAINLIHRLNTPFDHIDRILLQDFTEKMGLLSESTNAFKNTYLEDNGMFSAYHDQSKFFLDSFTYTPFIDYSQTKYANDENSDIKRTGVYSDVFLNDFNCGKYDDDDRILQFDAKRHPISSELFRMRNLQKDIEDVKISFRNTIS